MNDSRPDPTERASAPSRLRGIPGYFTGFVGRGATLASVLEWLEADARLLTVHGPPGIGKSRLATEFLRSEASARFPGGRFWCSLEGVATIDELLQRLATTLDQRIPSRRRGVEQLAHALNRRGRCLLVLDGAEAMADQLAMWLPELLEHTSELGVVLTSRRRTGIPGEVLIPVPPLAPVDARELLDDLVARHGVQPPKADLQSDIAAMTHGNPLLLEILSARLRTVSAAELLAEPPDAEEATGGVVYLRLNEAIQSSWDLLDDGSRQGLATASVFVSPFTVAAYCAIAQITPAEAELILGRLLDDALVRRVSTAEGAARFEMVNEIRDFARRQLAAGSDAPRVWRRTARWVVERAETVGGALEPGDGYALAELEELAPDLDGLLSRDEDPQYLARAVLALGPLLTRRGPPEAFLARLDRIPAGVEAELDLKLMMLRASAHWMLVEVDGLFTTLDRAITTARELDDKAAEAEAHQLKALAYLFRPGSLVQSESELHEATQLAGQLEDPGTLVAVLETSAEFAYIQCQFPRIAELARQAASVVDQSPDESPAGSYLGLQGLAALTSGRTDEAVRLYRQVATTSTEQGHSEHAIRADIHLAQTLHVRGELDEAADILDQALARARDRGYPGYFNTIGYVRANIHLERGELDSTERLIPHDEAGITLQGRASWNGIRGALALARGQLNEAHQFFATAVEQAHIQPAVRFEGIASCYSALAKELLGERDGAREAMERARWFLGDAMPYPIAVGQAALTGEELPDSSPCVMGAERVLATLVQELRTRPCWPVVVAEDGGWIRDDHGSVLSLARRRVLRNLLACLAAARLEFPGESVSYESIIEATWPQDRSHPDSIRARLHVAVRDLRRIGLGDSLLTTHDGGQVGYRLNRQVSVEPIGDRAPI